jgi:hypothetical protein
MTKSGRIVMLHRAPKIFSAIFFAVLVTVATHSPAWAQITQWPFSPGEKLKYQLRWGNIPAGEIELQVKPIETINGTNAYHFVMTTRSSGLVDIFFKLRERIDAYTDTQMVHSVLYKKRQTEGEHKRDERIEFDWVNNRAQYTNFDKKHPPIEVSPSTLDPLSAFYFTRVAIDHENSQMNRSVTDGKKIFMGHAKIVQRETITLSNGKTYDTFCLAPDMGLFGGVFEESKEAKLHVWVTADDKRIPVRIKSKVKVGHFIGELISVE